MSKEKIVTNKDGSWYKKGRKTDKQLKAYRKLFNKMCDEFLKKLDE